MIVLIIKGSILPLKTIKSKQMRFLLFFGFSFLVSMGIKAQNVKSSGVWIKTVRTGSPVDYFKREKARLGLSVNTLFKHVSLVEDKVSGMHHVRYQEYYKGLEVLGGVLIQHIKGEQIQSVNGYYWKQLEVNTMPALDKSAAIILAQHFCRSQVDAKNPIDPEKVRFHTINTPKLCIADKEYPGYSGEVDLAWAIDVEYVTNSLNIDRVLVNAHTGSVITSLPQVMNENIEVEVETYYIGKRVITIDSIAPNRYQLMDTTRGKGIVTKDGYRNYVYESKDKYDWFLYDRDYESAQDAHYAAEKYYDLLMDTFGFNSIDNKGFQLKSNIHFSRERSFVNAYWNGMEATFGDGDCQGYGPLTTLDVVGHEFTHGLTGKNSGLVYRDDPGGINEGMSDIFGKALEYYYDRAHFTWEIGRSFIQNNSKKPFRSMKDPNLYGSPKYYHGKKWYNEVHHTSGVLNHWFYLISEGEKGTNEEGVDYDVRGMGLSKALHIVFAMNTAYLTPTSTYPDAADASIAAVEELYGPSGPEMQAVVEAWKAVGLEPYTEKDNDLAIELIPDGDQGFIGISTCDATRHPVNIKITNLGRNTVPAGRDILVFMTNTSALKVRVPVTKDFVQGDEILYTLPDSVSFIGQKFKVINISAVLSPDEYALNNKSSIAYYVLGNSPGKDVAPVALQNRFDKCIDERSKTMDINFTISFRNNGCEDLDNDVLIHAALTINGSKVDVTHQLTDPLRISRRALLKGKGAFPIKAGLNDYVIDVGGNFDEHPENNQINGSFFIPLQVKNGYSEDFSNFELESQKKLRMDNSAKNIGLVSYKGEDYIAFAPGVKLDNDQLQPCPPVNRYWNSNGKRGFIEWCAATSLLPTGDNPVFEFDMVQLRTIDPDFPVNTHFQSILSIEVFSGSHKLSSKLYYGAKNGERMHYSVPLPLGDDIKVRMYALLVHGSFDKLERGKFSEVDAILIDNVTIGEPVVAVRDPLMMPLAVTPNPANDRVRFSWDKGGLQGAHLIIRDAMGRVLLHTPVKGDQYLWDAASAAPGICYYTLVQEGRVRAMGKVVILR